MSHFSQSCNRRKCSHCKNIVKSDVFTSNRTQNSFNLRFSIDCTSQNVIYLIECKRCNMQYVGQTNQHVSKRMNSHRFDINNFDSQGYASNIALHFNSYPHSIAISVFFQLMLLRMRWLVCVRKLIGYINLIPCTLKAWIPNYCTMFNSSLATIVCSYCYFFLYMHFIGIVVSYTIQ